MCFGEYLLVTVHGHCTLETYQHVIRTKSQGVEQGRHQIANTSSPYITLTW
jgi:hypothetical protein